jgi:MFS family permease
VIAAWGTGWVFVINGLTFVAMLIALAGMTTGFAPSGRARGGVRAGLSHVRRHPDLLFVIVVTGVVSTLALNFQLTVAVMATEEFKVGPVGFGLLATTMAVGSLSGALLAARRGRTSLRLIAGAALGLGVATIVAGAMPDPWTFGAALIACGATALTMMTAANSYLQTHAGSRHRGRVMALYLAVFFGATPLGAPVVGWIADVLGPRFGLVLPGAVTLVAVAGVSLAFRSAASRPTGAA